MAVLLLSALLLEARSAETFAGHTFYFGDIHAHTGISPDGGSSDLLDCLDPTVCGAIADVFTTAQANGLDFVAFSDHSVADPAMFDAFLADVIASTTDTFVTIPAVEMSLKWADTGTKFGHKNTYVFEDDNERLADLSLARIQGGTTFFASCDDVWTNAAQLTADFGPTLEFAHHPAAGDVSVTDWRCHDQTYEPVVEVYSGWGNSLDYESDYDRLQVPDESGTVHEALQAHGLRVGFVGGTDNHDSRPGETCETDSQWTTTHIYGGGLTMVVLDDEAPFVRSAIYGEMVARRTLVTTGPQVPVVVQWTTSDGRRHTIGEDLRVRDTDQTNLSVSVPPRWEGDVTAVTAVGYDHRVSLTETTPGKWSVSIGNAALPDWYYVEVSIDGAAYYGGVGACADFGGDDREFVWSSPVWFDHTDDLDGDGFQYDEDDCNDDMPRIHPGARDNTINGVDENCDGTDGRVRPMNP